MSVIVERLKDYLDFKGVSVSVAEKKIGVSNSSLSKPFKAKTTIKTDTLEKFLFFYNEINSEWLLTGKGKMLKENNNKVKESKNLIPFYEDVSTIGGDNIVAETDAIYNTSVQIDAGDWFKGATAAIRHYGDSMLLYPSGSVLAIRELQNKNEIDWGRNYVIETSELRITKQIAELDQEHIICYSTNTEKHPDGRLKHQPITISKKDIRHISRVLGCVTKEESTGKVQLI